MHGSVFFHANMHYAEIPRERLGELAERSYAPALGLLHDHPQFRAALEFSGFTLEWLEANRPDLIDLIRTLHARGQVELMGSTYADPILPLIPPDDAARQLDRYLAIHSRLFGGHRPLGLYVQEYSLDAATVEVLQQMGYRWVIVSSGQYRISKRELFNTRLQKVPAQEEFDAKEPVCRPFTIQGARGSSVTGLTWNMPGPNDLFWAWKDGRMSLTEVDGALGALDGDGFLFLCTADMEFVGDMPPQGSFPAPKLAEVLTGLTSVKWTLPGEYLAAHPPTEVLYLKTGAGSRLSDLANWTNDDDNRRLNALCDDARSQIRLTEALVGLVAALGAGVGEAQRRLAAARDTLLLADNSDGRGWKPIAQRRLDCFDHALTARDRAAEALQLATEAVKQLGFASRN
ncbi:MAG: putative alpha-amylase, family [Symbiobacteriaceae bacterium]|jgi:predicted glycosyl hydrolase (DUF1957 family)|nr:putative alpha-amylase, family [Symbiobacteriaceae bacterium]